MPEMNMNEPSPLVPSPANSLIETWRAILDTTTKSWVLFENGTCVILMDPASNSSLSEQAIELLKQWGPVHVGSSAGDFNIIELDGEPVSGWVVTGHHRDVLNYVPITVPSTSPNDGDSEGREGFQPSRFQAGLIGRGYRDQDAHELKIIHREDNRV
ncbi:hypothetical protein BJX99DRAFT_258491 [Aspergillus californicus]